MKKTLLLLILSFLITDSIAFDKDAPNSKCGEKQFLWKVSGESSFVWVLGSIHMADASFYPLSPVIESAFNTSETLVLEMDMSDNNLIQEVTELTLQEGLLPGGNLQEILPEKTWNRLKEVLENWNVSIEMFRFYRPWMAAMALSELAFQKAGISAEYGIDFVLLDQAATAGKAILGLETPKQQISALSEVSDSLGAHYLGKTLSEISGLDSLILEFKTAWKCGEILRMKKILESDTEAQDELEERLYHRRNEWMAQGIEKLISKETSAFVVVGAAHLIGKPKTVLQLLQEKGYRIKRY